MAYRKRAPTVLQVPNGSGVGAQPPIQVPISDDSIISLTNLSAVAITLSNDETFSMTWPLPAGATNPQPGIDNLWMMNNSGTDAEVLVLTYDARFPGLVNPGGGGGYASLTGPGKIITPGALTQAGALNVSDDGESEPDTIFSVLSMTPLQDMIVRIAGVINFQGSQFNASSDVGGIIISAEDQLTLLSSSAAVLLKAQTAVEVDANALNGTILIGGSSSKFIGFYGSAPIARPPNPVTLADVITGLVDLGLFAP